MEEFHVEFNNVMGFPSFYGNNMNAWIDCMTSVDVPEDGLITKNFINKGELLVLKICNINEMIKNCPIAYDCLVDGVAFVNYRRMEVGENPVLILSYFADPNR